MSEVHVTLTGLDELRAELRALPPALKVEASHEAEAAANGTAATVMGVYGQHAFTGTLRDSVRVSHKDATATAVATSTVRVNSPIAWLFDNGSQVRKYVTAHGKTHLTGRMPAMHIFDRTAARARRRLYGRLTDMLVRYGAKVTGSA